MPAARKSPGKRKTQRRPSSKAKLLATSARIVLKHRGDLAKHGYSGVKSLTVGQRHAALESAVGEYGPTYVIRKLNVLSIYNKNKDPDLWALFRADMAYVQSLKA